MGNTKQTNKETAHCCKKAETVFSHALATLHPAVCPLVRWFYFVGPAPAHMLKWPKIQPQPSCI